jgi:PAS domain S-box-containing protein
MTRPLANRKIQLVFGTAILTLLVMGAISYQARVLSNESDRWVEHTHEVLENLQDLQLAMETAKSSYREFLLTGDESALGPFRSNQLIAMQRIKAIRNLTVDNASQQNRIANIERLTVQRFQFAEMVIALRRMKGSDAAADAVRSKQNRQTVDEFSAVLRETQAEELRLLGLRSSDVARRLRQTKASLIGLTILALFIVIAAGWNVQRENIRRTLAEQFLDSEQATAALLDLTYDAIFVRNLKNEIVFWNKSAERLYGWNKEEASGKVAHELLHTVFSCPLADIGAEVLRKGSWEGELIHQQRDGTSLTVSSRWAVQMDGSGRPVATLESNRDVSQQQQVDRRFRGLMEAAPDAMVVVNQSGEIVLLNLQAERKFGYSRDELVGRKVKSIIPEGFEERLIADGTRTAAVALMQQIGTGIELSGRRKDGSEFPIEIMLSPLENAEGILVTAAIRDISVRKAAEEHLVQMEGRYRGLLEAAPDAMVVVNQAGEIALLNLQAERKFGYSRDELLGQKVTSIIPEGFAERLIADGTRTATEALLQQMGTGIELYGRRKDGSQFPIEIMLSPLQSAEGILVTAAIRDIAVRKAAEENLRQSEERMSLVVTNATDYSILMLDLEGRVVSWNEGAQRIKGYRAEEILGRHFSCFYTAEDIANGIPAMELAEVTRSGRFEQEGWRVRKDGSQFYSNVVITALRDKTGQLRGFGKIARDITERIRTEEHQAKAATELKRSNDQLEQFAYVASHDLQEPLRMVASYTQLLAKRYKGRLDSDADEFIAYAVDGCNRMQSLIRDLLAYSRSGGDGRALREASGNAALQEALTNLRGAIEDSGAIVTHDPLPNLVTDETQLVQLFQNLVGNAIKYHGPAIPLVHVSAMQSGDREWIFSVRDNGLGIAPQYFERIFIIFQRLHGKHEFEGTGIGLAICKKNVEQLGGRIWVESQVDNGSTFYFALPVHEGK